MKRLLLVMAALSGALLFSKCKCNETKPQAKTAADSISGPAAKTLNNIDEGTAGKMIQHFLDLKDKDKNPASMSFFISRDMIHKIVTLLHKEIAEQKAQAPVDPQDPLKGITDGIRIYFASNLSVNTYPLDNTILLVSTLDNGPVKPGTVNSKTKRAHKDYYQHASNDELFMLRNYEVPCVSAGCPGSLLYVTNPKTPSCGSPNGITVDTAELMVANFKTPHIINTQAVWFELALFDAIDQSKVLEGVRIYFAKHLTSKDTAISQRNTVVFTCAKRDPVTGIMTDYFECEKVFKEYLEKRRRLYPGPGDPFDNGELCPDNCN